MTLHTLGPVLLVGGTGTVGRLAAQALRRLHPSLPLAIGGRDLGKAEALTRELGDGVTAVAVDLDRPGLGLASGTSYGALVLFVKDHGLHAMRHAQATGAALLGISSGSFEVAPEVARFISRPKAAPVLMLSHWLAGAALFPALQAAREFERLERIEIGAVLDEQDLGGPAAHADFERLTTAAPHAQILRQGRWGWATGADARRRFRRVDGVEVEGTAYAPLDTMSLATATGAADVRFDLVLGESSSRHRGEPYSTEILIELAGLLKQGGPGRRRLELVHPLGQAPLTAMGVAVAVERLLGCAGGAPVAPGLYLPEVLIDPEHAVQRLQAAGARLRLA
ncbi:NAD(P)-dependent oxidoreductase [Eleftheria terrae]|uniref:NAD(P)-dependent oxidoreductase n=1 Tax=Eleftheria terrae TaxID=1597781 RepID=UPI00263B59A6|nr:NAD(P)-dependent oxidoreductase [Eleftheria terrae]WKB55486.1 NAD(P)-dependent oxidoreductase [Eleftheria terrae]